VFQYLHRRKFANALKSTNVLGWVKMGSEASGGDDMKRVLAMILAAERAKPAVSFGGKYRIIDFSLSNCANSGIHNVAVLTQFNPRSLAQHIGIGRPWDLDRSAGGVVLLQPFLSRSTRDWYRGTADAVYQNLYFLEDKRIDEVLILSGDHVYAMRYDHMIASHRSRQADITIAVMEVPLSEVSRFGIITLDHNERLVKFEEKPKIALSNLRLLWVYMSSTRRFLLRFWKKLLKRKAVTISAIMFCRRLWENIRSMAISFVVTGGTWVRLNLIGKLIWI